MDMDKNTYISAYIMGGLGNQLFQIFATIATAIKQNKKFIFPFYEDSPGMTKRPTYWNTFLKKLLPFTTYNNNQINNNMIQNYFTDRELNHNFNEIRNLNHNTMLFGYYQSYKYFNSEFNDILKIINFDSIKDIVYNNYKHLFISNNSNIITISIHFRFGDYLSLDGVFEILDDEYYINAIKHIIHKDLTKNVKFLIFFESSDSNRVSDIILKIKEFTDSHDSFNFEFTNVPHDIPDWQQLILMSCCNHNIIANSSFSWWGAFFNDYNYKLVCYPNKWFGHKERKRQVEMYDMFPPSWTSL
tara:strand:+ start:9073 stop:9975 length:903 start_codon:yes stop_codon:yes gene_type:complete